MDSHKIFYIFFASHENIFLKIIEVSKHFSITAVSLSTISQRNLSPSYGMLRVLC